MHDLALDLRLGLRLLVRRPAFAALVIALLGLGIGASVTVFALVEALLLRPLPYEHAERLVRVYGSNPERGWDRFGTSAPDLRDQRERIASLDRLEAYHYAEANLASERGADRVEFLWVTPTIFETVGAAAAVGRTFAPGEDAPGRNRVVVLGHGFWQRRFGGDPEVVGQRVRADGEELEIIGVMPEGFFLPAPDIAFWRPLDIPGDPNGRGARYLSVIGRLAEPGAQARAGEELATVARALAAAYPDTNFGWTVTLVPARDWIAGDARGVVLLLWGAVGAVLLVASANVGTLLLARADSRRTEMATRAALGANRSRLLRQVLVECLVLAGAGGALGLALAAAAIRALPLVPGIDLPRLEEVRLGAPVALFALGLSLATVLLFGLAPAAALSRSAFHRLRTRALGGRGRLTAGLVFGQVGIAMLLLVGSALVLGSLLSLVRVDPGFDPDRLLAMRVAPPLPALEQAESMERLLELFRASRTEAGAFYDTLLERLRGVPEVSSVAAINFTPLAGGWWLTGVVIDGQPRPDHEQPSAAFRAVTAGYFETAGIELARGRAFVPGDDRDGAPLVAVIDRQLAHDLVGDADPIGLRIRVDEVPLEPYTIVGVVDSVRQTGLDAPLEPTVYVPFRQAYMGFGDGWAMTILARTYVDASAVADRLRREVEAVRPDLPVFDVTPMDRFVAGGTASRRAAALVLTSFAGVSLLLAAIGVFGVMAQKLEREAPALALRMALGARPLDVVTRVVRQGLLLVLGGGAIGLLAARAAAPLLRSRLFGISPDDPRVYLVALGTLALAALAACAMPARRAARIEAAEALRTE
jgi:predicted permease